MRERERGRGRGRGRGEGEREGGGEGEGEGEKGREGDHYILKQFILNLTLIKRIKLIPSIQFFSYILDGSVVKMIPKKQMSIIVQWMVKETLIGDLFFHLNTYQLKRLWLLRKR